MAKKITDFSFAPTENYFAIAASSLITLFWITVVGGVILAVFLVAGLGSGGREEINEIIGPVLALGSIRLFCIFILIWMLAFILRWLTYSKTSLTVTKDKVRYTEGFLNTETVEILCEKVTDIVLTQNIFQRLFLTGTIKFITAGTGVSGIQITDVDNPDKAYTAIRNIVLKKKNKK